MVGGKAERQRNDRKSPKYMNSEVEVGKEQRKVVIKKMHGALKNTESKYIRNQPTRTSRVLPANLKQKHQLEEYRFDCK